MVKPLPPKVFPCWKPLAKVKQPAKKKSSSEPFTPNQIYEKTDYTQNLDSTHEVFIDTEFDNAADYGNFVCP